MKQKLPFLLLSISILFGSCAAHKRSHVRADEEFVLELKRPATRGGAIDLALQGLFLEQITWLKDLLKLFLVVMHKIFPLTTTTILTWEKLKRPILKFI